MTAVSSGEPERPAVEELAVRGGVLRVEQAVEGRPVSVGAGPADRRVLVALEPVANRRPRRLAEMNETPEVDPPGSCQTCGWSRPVTDRSPQTRHSSDRPLGCRRGVATPSRPCGRRRGREHSSVVAADTGRRTRSLAAAQTPDLLDGRRHGRVVPEEGEQGQEAGIAAAQDPGPIHVLGEQSSVARELLDLLRVARRGRTPGRIRPCRPGSWRPIRSSARATWALA